MLKNRKIVLSPKYSAYYLPKNSAYQKIVIYKNSEKFPKIEKLGNTARSVPTYSKKLIFWFLFE